MNSDMDILLKATPQWQIDRVERKPALSDFQSVSLNANDQRRRPPILTTVTQQPRSASGGGGNNQGATVQFLVPSNGGFGVIDVFTAGPITPI